MKGYELRHMIRTLRSVEELLHELGEDDVYQRSRCMVIRTKVEEVRRVLEIGEGRDAPRGP